MKKLIFCRRKHFWQILVSARFRTFVSPAIFTDSEVLEAEDWYTTRVIQDKDLLRKSQDNSGAGLHVLDLIDQGSMQADRTFYSKLLKRCTQMGKLREGKMVHAQPNQFTISSVLKASGNGTTDKRGRQLHAYCLKCGYDSDVYVGSSLVDMYARYGHMVDAWSIFDGLVTKNEVSWNALIAGHARKGETENALRLFCKMQREDFKATHFTYSSLCTACASTGSLEQGKWVHAHVIKSGGRLVAFVGNTLLDMYAKSGSIEDAKKVFDRLVKRDVVSWNSMLTGYAQHGLGKKTVQHFQEMMTSGVEPNDITFLSVLTACSHAGLLDEGQHYFELMNKYKVKPDVSHYVTMVDLLGRAGLLDRAQKFISEMPSEPTAAVWGALLGACRMHKNMELGAYAAERVFELDPHDSGPHILLYNMYASAGRWHEAVKVRKMMKESGVKKEPACSWVEIENSVHMFIANDDTHPQWEEIRQMWEKISGKIREIGYVPDTSHVLLFVDQQEREVKLQYHSEKLALAFALLNTPPGSTIRIKKNIRVCGDCHSAIKYVSKVVAREIIMSLKYEKHCGMDVNPLHDCPSPSPTWHPDFKGYFGSKITINYPLNDLKETMENMRAEYSHVLKAEKTRDMNILDERTSNIVSKKDELNCTYLLSL
ncbi:hypothetical protein TIFTF001_006231 [Ficus carica]|uniref:DYW domain-containing protein n=1 Tax=Ficus carica TaxID=3494 RepID=A0AA87ZNJ0_FICCA|nr:hypothetical protein TIFTF001_006231 [Ficus carica]